MDASKILVTGGAGFIGSHIAARLVAYGYQVFIVDDLSSGKMENVPPGAIFYKIDIRDAAALGELFERERFGVLVHEAAQMSVIRSVKDPANDALVNIVGLYNLLEAGRKNGLRKVLCASSGGVIYGEPEKSPQREDHSLKPKSPYGISKLATEHILRFYWETYQLPYIALRYANVYGPRQNPESGAGVIAHFMRKILAGEAPVINGTGNKTRDYIYVSDVVEANKLALTYHGVGAFNIGTGIETDVNTVFRMIRNLTQLDIPEVHGPEMLGENVRSVLDISRSRKILGWTPHIAFEDGLRETIEWYIKSGTGENCVLTCLPPRVSKLK